MARRNKLTTLLAIIQEGQSWLAPDGRRFNIRDLRPSRGGPRVRFTDEHGREHDQFVETLAGTLKRSGATIEGKGCRAIVKW